MIASIPARSALITCAVIVRGVFVGNYKSPLLSRLYLNYCVAHVIAVVEMGFNSPSGLIVFEQEQTSLLAKRACAGQGQPARIRLRKSVLARRRIELE